MKRARELRSLSEDHHHGLVLARRARSARDVPAGSLQSMWAEVLEAFETDLEPHFRIEESFLAPGLEAVGESELVRRLLDEHAALRRCVAVDGGRTREGLARLGELLERHIRFEERELFEVAQRRLAPETLRVVAAACEAEKARR